MINFKEGKTCQDVTQAPMGFKLDPKFGCYVTDYVRRGETTSLMFIEAWSHAYDVKVQGIIAPVPR